MITFDFRGLLWSVQGLSSAYAADWMFGAPVNLMPRGLIGLVALLGSLLCLVWLDPKRAGR